MLDGSCESAGPRPLGGPLGRPLGGPPGRPWGGPPGRPFGGPLGALGFGGDVDDSREPRF